MKLLLIMNELASTDVNVTCYTTERNRKTEL